MLHDTATSDSSMRQLEQRPDERPLRLSTDLLRRTYWLHTDQSIFELVIQDEDRDVWKTYLARSNWDEALRHAKVSQSHRLTMINITETLAYHLLDLVFVDSSTSRYCQRSTSRCLLYRRSLHPVCTVVCSIFKRIRRGRPSLRRQGRTRCSTILSHFEARACKKNGMQ